MMTYTDPLEHLMPIDPAPLWELWACGCRSYVEAQFELFPSKPPWCDLRSQDCGVCWYRATAGAELLPARAVL